MREDNRAFDQLREVEIIPKYLKTNPASVLIKLGNTHVLVACCIENTVPKFLKNTGCGWLRAEYSMLPHSSWNGRIQRDTVKGRISGRNQEIQRMIGRALRMGVRWEDVGERTVVVDCDVLQADGGTRVVAITGGFVAMCLLFEKMLREGELKIFPINELISAVSVGIVNGKKLLDLTYKEDFVAEADINVVMTHTFKLVELQATAEKLPFLKQDLDELLELAKIGIKELTKIQLEVLKDIKLLLPQEDK